jgi:predicted O-methyltransferase YrrM
MVAYSTPEEFREIVYMFQRSRIILTAFELGIFTALGDAHKPSADVADEVQADARATDRLMNALVVCGLLEKQGELFCNTPFAAKYLVKGKDDYLRGMGHSSSMWHTWSQLTEAVRAGHTIRDDKEHGDGWRKNFLAAMHERGMRQAPDVIAKLDLAHVQKVLDVGGGSGAYAITFARAKPQLEAVIFDQPHMLHITKQYIEKAGMADRISTRAGNYHTDPFGCGYDLIFLSAIVHINSFDENRSLIKKCADAMNPGGMVVIQDHVMDEGRTSPDAGVFFALNMIVATDRGDTYTETEMQSWMRDAGLKDFQRMETYNNAMIIGYK